MRWWRRYQARPRSEARPEAENPGRPPLVEDGGLVVLSYCFPPMTVGPAFIIDRLFGEFDLRDTIIFAGRADRHPGHAGFSGRAQATVRRYDVPAWWPAMDTAFTIGRYRVPFRIRAAGNVLVALRVALAATRALAGRRARALLVVYPKQHFLLAGCLASFFSSKPLFVYFTDVYVEGLPSGHRTARLIERRVARRASAVFGMSDPHCRHLERRLWSNRVESPRIVEIPHPYLAADTDAATTMSLLGRPSIVFTGAIYDAQAEAIRRLIEALDSRELYDFGPHVNLFTQTDRDMVADWGIAPGRRVSLHAVASEAAQAAQRQADILFLPISFDARPDVVRTASPTKLPEYLAARRPMLVHAPAESYIARYADENGFAELVTDPDPEALARAVRRLASDDLRRSELVRNARVTLQRHEVSKVANTLRIAVRDALEPPLSRPG